MVIYGDISHFEALYWAHYIAWARIFVVGNRMLMVHTVHHLIAADVWMYIAVACCSCLLFGRFWRWTKLTVCPERWFPKLTAVPC